MSINKKGGVDGSSEAHEEDEIPFQPTRAVRYFLNPLPFFRLQKKTLGGSRNIQNGTTRLESAMRCMLQKPPIQKL